MKAEDAEKLMLALVSAYVWVATADEGVEVVEYTHFFPSIVKSPFATHFDEDDLRHTFKDMVRLFEDDFDAALKLTRQRIQAYKNEPIMAEEIIRMARAAVVGDGQLKAPEESVLGEIESALG